jgi:hypothetical protein
MWRLPTPSTSATGDGESTSACIGCGQKKKFSQIALMALRRRQSSAVFWCLIAETARYIETMTGYSWHKSEAVRAFVSGSPEEPSMGNRAVAARIRGSHDGLFCGRAARCDPSLRSVDAALLSSRLRFGSTRRIRSPGFESMRSGNGGMAELVTRRELRPNHKKHDPFLNHQAL